MLQKVNKKARARKSAPPNFSLHFKDLSDGDNVSEDREEEASLMDSNPTVTQLTHVAPEVKSTVVPVSKQANLLSTADPLNLFAEKQLGVEEKSNINSNRDEKTESTVPSVNTKPREIVPSPQLTNKGTRLISDKENVAIHPLLINSESESSEEEDFPSSLARRDPLNPTSTQASRPQQITKPKMSLESMFYSSTSPVTSTDPYSKGLLSNALINSKAKSKLLFSALKKNIQQYAGANMNFQGKISGIEPAELKSATTSSSSRLIQEEDDSFTDLSPFADDHFAEMKPEEHTTHPLQEAADGSNEDTFLRKRSSSENNSLFGLVSKQSSNMENKVLTHARKLSDATQRSLFSLSFSDLKAERKKSVTDSISVASLDYANQLVESEETNAKQSSVENEVLETVASETEFSDSSPLLFETIYVWWLCVFLYFITPIPFYIHLCVCSFFLGCFIMILVLCMCSSRKKSLQAIVPPYTTMKTIPSSIPKSLYDPDQPLKGWMNVIDDYDVDTYHINSTRSVYVTLEKSILRLQTPRRNISRRAIHREGNLPITNVIHQKIYDMNNARVYLLPYGLVKKRVWNKKYPICIEFGNQHAQSEVPGLSTTKLYIFGRTGRQKQEWFYRFQRAIIAAKLKASKEYHDAMENIEEGHETEKSEEDCTNLGAKTIKSYYDSNRNLFNPDSTYHDYFTSMCRLLPDPAAYTVVQSGNMKKEEDTVNMSNSDSIQFSSGHVDVVSSQPKIALVHPGPGEPGLEVAWFNVFVGRIMFDFLRQSRWADWLSNKIQKKLDKIKLPYFMDGLKLGDIDLGTAVPLVQCISLPSLNSQGIWLDMDVTYSGSIQMTLETKMVLTKLGKTDTVVHVKKKSMDGNSAVLNSEEEDSAESSEDDESTVTKFVRQVSPSSLMGSQVQIKSKGQSSSESGVQSSSSSSTPQEKRWVRIVDSITKSKYFQKAAESNYIRKKLETVSNTPLILNVELNQCQGRLGINIPPPPSDRVWYGFRESPNMVLRAHPKFGERAVTATLVVDWIEKKLLQEFDKFLLIPNMDDIPIPLMFNNLPDLQQS